MKKEKQNERKRVVNYTAEASGSVSEEKEWEIVSERRVPEWIGSMLSINLAK